MTKTVFFLLAVSTTVSCAVGFLLPPSIADSQPIWNARIVNKKCFGCYATSSKSEEGQGKKVGDNKAMAFLRKMGKVGGASSEDLANAMGVDEGPAGKTTSRHGAAMSIRKAKSAYKECTVTGVIDNMDETFPFTSSGTQWSGFTDRVMGGMSSGRVERLEVDGRTANVLRGKVSLANDGGFVQMAADLALNPSLRNTVDASEYDGIEIEAYCDTGNESEDFNIHLKNLACTRQFSSYRATFKVPARQWTNIRLPWSNFQGAGPGAVETHFDASSLRRIGIVAIGREMDVYLAVSGLRFYSVI